MDQLRADLIASAQSLLRLALRIDARLARSHHLDQHLVCVKNLEQCSPWIDAVNPGNALCGVRARIVEVAERLLALARTRESIDARYAALVMQVVAGDAQRFCSRVRRFAERHNVILPEWMRDEPGAYEAAHDVTRAVNRITGAWPEADKESGIRGYRGAQGGESNPIESAPAPVPPDIPCRSPCT